MEIKGFCWDTLLRKAPLPLPAQPFYVELQPMRGFWCQMKSGNHSAKCPMMFSSVQFSRSVVSDSAIPWTAACQASLSVTNTRSLLKLMSIELMMPSNNLALCHLFLLPPSIFPSIRVFQMSRFFTSGGQSIGVSASASVLPMNIQD